MPSLETEVEEKSSPFAVVAEDEAAFVASAETLATGICALYRPPQFHLVKIDNWFGPRWLQFSGKILGAAGVWQTNTLTLPPIVPNRVVFERTLERSANDGRYGNAALQRTLHIVQVSSQNLRRYTQALAPELAVLWFSGASAASGRGAIMAHIPAEGFHWPWYVELAAERGWGLSMHKGISPVEFRHLWHAGETSSAPWKF